MGRNEELQGSGEGTCGGPGDCAESGQKGHCVCEINQFMPDSKDRDPLTKNSLKHEFIKKLKGLGIFLQLNFVFARIIKNITSF